MARSPERLSAGDQIRISNFGSPMQPTRHRCEPAVAVLFFDKRDIRRRTAMGKIRACACPIKRVMQLPRSPRQGEVISMLALGALLWLGVNEVEGSAAYRGPTGDSATSWNSRNATWPRPGNDKGCFSKSHGHNEFAAAWSDPSLCLNRAAGAQS